MITTALILAVVFLGISMILHVPNWERRHKYRQSIRAFLTPNGRRPSYVVIGPNCPPELIEPLKAAAIAEKIGGMGKTWTTQEAQCDLSDS